MDRRRTLRAPHSLSYPWCRGAIAHGWTGLDCKVHETPVPPSVVGVVEVAEFAAVLDAVGFRLVASLPAESCFPLVAGRPDDPSTVVPEQGGGRQSDCLTLFDTV